MKRLPKVLFARYWPTRPELLDARESLTDFEGLHDAPIGAYKLESEAKLTISEKPKKESR
jgi:hypothetical protein